MSAIVLRVHDPRHDNPGEVREIEFESGFFPGKGQVAFEIDQFLNGIRESV